jgi:hypothetical protein
MIDSPKTPNRTVLFHLSRGPDSDPLKKLSEYGFSFNPEADNPQGIGISIVSLWSTRALTESKHFRKIQRGN